LQQLDDFGVNIYELRFSDDGRCLETDRGILDLHSDQSAISSVNPQKASHVFVDRGWITRGKKNLLWLPADYRGSCFAWRDNVLAIGQQSGQVHFYDFNI